MGGYVYSWVGGVGYTVGCVRGRGGGDWREDTLKGRGAIMHLH